jgi:hypothetical protein
VWCLMHYVYGYILDLFCSVRRTFIWHDLLLVCIWCLKDEFYLLTCGSTIKQRLWLSLKTVLLSWVSKVFWISKVDYLVMRTTRCLLCFVSIVSDSLLKQWFYPESIKRFDTSYLNVGQRLKHIFWKYPIYVLKSIISSKVCSYKVFWYKTYHLKA